MKTRQEFGKFLALRRDLSGVSQVDVARRLGLGNSQFVSNIERGLAMMPPGAVRTWALAIKMEPLELFKIRLRVINSEIEKKFNKGYR